MKKIIAASAVTSLLILALSVTAFAGGGGCHSRKSTNGTGAASYSVCFTKNCTLEDLHTHNNKTYTPHYYGDGHDYHEYCSVEDCTENGYHLHDGTYCFGHTVNDGHSYHKPKHRGGGGRHH